MRGFRRARHGARLDHHLERIQKSLSMRDRYVADDHRGMVLALNYELVSDATRALESLRRLEELGARCRGERFARRVARQLVAEQLVFAGEFEHAATLLDELLAPERVTAEGLFQVDTIERLRREHLAGSANHSHILWSLIVFQDWRGRWQV